MSASKLLENLVARDPALAVCLALELVGPSWRYSRVNKEFIQDGLVHPHWQRHFRSDYRVEMGGIQFHVLPEASARLNRESCTTRSL